MDHSDESVVGVRNSAAESTPGVGDGRLSEQRGHRREKNKIERAEERAEGKLGEKRAEHGIK